LGLPTAAECVSQINAMLASSKINFEPGSSVITPEGAPIIEKIAGRMKDCADFPMEIAGHTDSQGREEMNLSLSQDRAQAIITALMAHRVLTGNLTAHGYGETRPIADNETEEGREANRRIEFTLLDGGEATDAGAIAEDAAEGEVEGEIEVIAVEADEATVNPKPRPASVEEAAATAAAEAIDPANAPVEPTPLLPTDEGSGDDQGSGDGQPGPDEGSGD
jgi:OOP family OmpA-OmpF porin